jgi:hypothetical protein
MLLNSITSARALFMTYDTCHDIRNSHVNGAT